MQGNITCIFFCVSYFIDNRVFGFFLLFFLLISLFWVYLFNQQSFPFCKHLIPNTGDSSFRSDNFLHSTKILTIVFIPPPSFKQYCLLAIEEGYLSWTTISVLAWLIKEGFTLWRQSTCLFIFLNWHCMHQETPLWLLLYQLDTRRSLSSLMITLFRIFSIVGPGRSVPVCRPLPPLIWFCRAGWNIFYYNRNKFLYAIDYSWKCIKKLYFRHWNFSNNCIEMYYFLGIKPLSQTRGSWELLEMVMVTPGGAWL